MSKMSKIQILRAQVVHRLTAAVEEILGLFERAMAESEERCSRSQRENDRLRKLLISPRARLHAADTQQLLVQQEQPELRGLEEADTTKFPFSHVTMKDEGDEVTDESSQLHQSQPEDVTDAQPPPSSSSETDIDGEDRGASQAARRFNPEPQHVLLQDVWSLGVEQEEPEPPPTNQAQDRIWSGREAAWLHHLSDAVVTKLPSALVVRRVDDANTRSSWLRERHGEQKAEKELPFNNLAQQTTAEAAAKRGGADAAWKSDPASHLQASSGDETEPSEGDWTETREPRASPSPQRRHAACVSGLRRSVGETSFSCSECGATFKYHKNLLRHTRNHSVDKPFTCTVCGKGFHQNETLNRHLRTHTGEKPFSCPVCSKTFTQNVHLKVHIRTHTGERPFICPLCGKTFRQQGNLKRHAKIHTSEKPYGCSICGKYFALRGHLKKHLEIHTGGKPFGCFKCGKRFRQKQNLKRHKLIHIKKETLRFCF